MIGIAERAGVRISFKEFTRFGAGVAAATIAISSLYLATHVYLGAKGALLVWLAVIAVILLVKVMMRIRLGRQLQTVGTDR